MKGVLIQISNIDDESIGLWYTEEKELIDNPSMLVDWFRDYDDSDKYDEDGIDGFDEYVKENQNYVVERVFINFEIL